jgi:hypothetical protein
MARSAIARFTRSLHRRCMARPACAAEAASAWRRPAGAALIALALGGAVAGGAMALSPTVDTALVFRGGVNIVADAPANVLALAYTVPAGRKFMLTDLAITNGSETTVAIFQSVFTGSHPTCAFLSENRRTNFFSVPAGSTLHLPFVTGIGFTAGQQVCIANGDSADATYWTIRGYLFE